MSLIITLFVCLLTNFLFSYRGYEATPTKSLTIADSMKSMEICNSVSNVLRSHYLEECGKVDLPEKNAQITKINRNQFLCLALDDRFTKVCHYMDSSKGKKTVDIPVLNNQTVFNEAIDAILSTKDEKLWALCANLTYFSSPVSNETMLFVSQLQIELTKSKMDCAEICNTDNTETSGINPLCAALGIIDQKIKENMSDGFELEKNPKINTHANIPEAANTKTVENAQTNSPKQTTYSAQLHSTVKNDSHTSNQSKNEINSHNDIRGSKLMDGKEKIVPGSAELNNPAISDLNPNRPILVNKSDGTMSSLPPKSDKNIDVVTNLIKPTTTLSEQTSDDQQGEEQSSDYNNPPTDNNERFEADDLDDGQRLLPKDMTQLDEDQIDEREKTPRFTSIHTEDDSHFLGYFTIIGLIGIGGCLLYHHKQKILAMIVEGRRSRGGRGRKRPSTASYRKLDCNLEEAVTSQCNSNVTHVIY